jgi:hypothetical protein
MTRVVDTGVLHSELRVYSRNVEKVPRIVEKVRSGTEETIRGQGKDDS